MIDPTAPTYKVYLKYYKLTLFDYLIYIILHGFVPFSEYNSILNGYKKYIAERKLRQFQILQKDIFILLQATPEEKKLRPPRIASFHKFNLKKINYRPKSKRQLSLEVRSQHHNGKLIAHNILFNYIKFDPKLHAKGVDINLTPLYDFPVDFSDFRERYKITYLTIQRPFRFIPLFFISIFFSLFLIPILHPAFDFINLSIIFYEHFSEFCYELYTFLCLPGMKWSYLFIFLFRVGVRFERNK